MKRLIAAAVLLLFIIGVNVAGFKITDKYFEEMENRLAACENEYRNGNKKSAADMAADLEDYWHESEKVLIIFLNRYSVDEIAETANRLRSFSESESDAMFYCEAAVCRHLLEDMQITEKYLIY